MIPDQNPLRVQRDAWTRLLYLQLGAFAFFLYAFSPAIGFLKDDLHISAGVAGLHSTAYAVGVMVGGVTAPWYIKRSGGSRPALWIGLLGLCSAVAVFCAVPALPVTLPASAVCGVFGAYLCIAVPSALARAHGAEVGPAAITEANAVAAISAIAAPLALGGAAGAGIGWRTAFLTVIPLCAVLYLFLGRVLEPVLIGIPAQRQGPDLVEAPRRGAASDNAWRTLPKRFWINQLAGVCAGGIEFSFALWCSTLLRDRAGLSHSVAATGVTALVTGMAVGRLIGGRLVLRFSLDLLLYASFACTAAGFALFWIASSAVPMFAGLAVAGLGVSVQFPLVSARGINYSGGRAELAGSVNMLGAGIASGTAPFALGVLSDRIGIHAAYLLVPALIAAAVVALAASGTTHRPAEAPLPSESMAA